MFPKEEREKRNPTNNGLVQGKKKRGRPGGKGHGGKAVV